MRIYLKNLATPPADGDLNLRRLAAYGDQADGDGGSKYPTHDQFRRLYTGDVQRLKGVETFTAFKAVVTTDRDLAVGSIRVLTIGGIEYRYVFTEDADANMVQSLPQIVLPDDYDADDHAFYWKLVRAPVPNGAKWHLDPSTGRLYGKSAQSGNWHEAEFTTDPGFPTVATVVDAGTTPMDDEAFAAHLAGI